LIAHARLSSDSSASGENRSPRGLRSTGAPAALDRHRATALAERRRSMIAKTSWVCAAVSPNPTRSKIMSDRVYGITNFHKLLHGLNHCHNSEIQINPKIELSTGLKQFLNTSLTAQQIAQTYT
jgi:hypothetical protein